MRFSKVRLGEPASSHTICILPDTTGGRVIGTVTWLLGVIAGRGILCGQGPVHVPYVQRVGPVAA